MDPRNLPIYRVTYELLLQVSQLVKNFRKDLKISLGKRIIDECIELILCVYRSNTSRGQERRQHIQQVLSRVRVLELTLRLSMDMKLISIVQHARVAKLTDEIGRQAYGWLKSTPEK